MKNASKWCSDFCAKNPIPSGLQKRGKISRKEAKERYIEQEAAKNLSTTSSIEEAIKAQDVATKSYKNLSFKEKRKLRKFETESSKPQQSYDPNPTSEMGSNAGKIGGLIMNFVNTPQQSSNPTNPSASQKKGAIYKKGCKKY